MGYFVVLGKSFLLFHCKLSPEFAEIYSQNV